MKTVPSCQPVKNSNSSQLVPGKTTRRVHSGSIATACAAVLIASAVAPSAHAISLTWDTTIAADATVTAGSGIWTNGACNWNNGTTSVGFNWNNVTPDTATFAGADGTYTITVGGAITAGGITFSDSGYILSAPDLPSAQQISLSGNIVNRSSTGLSLWT